MAPDPAGIRDLAPGFAALAAVAVVAHFVALSVPHVDALVLAVGLGALIGNTAGLPRILRHGVDRYKLLLETGIVLLGASVSVDRLALSGPVVIALVIATVVFAIGFVEVVSRAVVSLPRRSSSLLAAGASICGVSAVTAVARGIDADQETLAYTVGAVLLFDAVTLVTFPAVGGWLGLPDQVFGVWAGLAMFSTGPVAAAGFAYSPAAGRWATVTKLVRNALIGVVATGYAVAYVRREGDSTGFDVKQVWAEFPKFLVGFVLLVVVANAGVVSSDGIAALAAASEWLFALAFAGVGFSIRVEEIRAAGLAPVAVLLAYVLVAGTLTLLAVRAFI